MGRFVGVLFLGSNLWTTPCSQWYRCAQVRSRTEEGRERGAYGWDLSTPRPPPLLSRHLRVTSVEETSSGLAVLPLFVSEIYLTDETDNVS